MVPKVLPFEEIRSRRSFVRAKDYVAELEQRADQLSFLEASADKDVELEESKEAQKDVTWMS